MFYNVLQEGGSMEKNYTVKIACVLLSTEVCKNKQFVLSLDKENIQVPILDVNDEFLANPPLYLVKKLKEYIFVSDMDLIPQLISIKQTLKIEPEENHTSNKDMYIVYGFLVPKSYNLNNVHWIEFDYQTPNKYSHILFEVTQKLQ